MRNLTPDDDFAFDTAQGLPEALPRGEHILWQGRPRVLALARQSLWLDWVVGYFALLAVWRVGVSSTEFPPATALGHGVPFLLIGVVAAGLILGFTWLQVRGTVYTITSHRVAMRIGAALQITLNLPYTQISNAALHMRGRTGTIALTLAGDDKVSYLVAWPHVRPWRMAEPAPALRCIPEADRVARLLAGAVETRRTAGEQPQVARRPDHADDIPTAIPAE
ncbi:MAG: photosynthetic complex putative assembly protein PuhB [Shimia sp.]